MYNKRKEYMMADKSKSPTVVKAGEPVDQGISLTDKQRASGTQIYFTPPQDGVDVATSVKATSLEKAQELTGVPAPIETEAPADEPTDNTDEGSN